MQDTVIKFIAETTKTDVGDIKPESYFIDDLKFDSLDLVEIIMKIEDEFGVEIPEEEAEGLKRVSDVVAYLEKAKKRTAAPPAG